MSKRLQVIMAAKEYRALQLSARTSGVSVGEWVRRSIRGSMAAESGSGGAGEKLGRLERILARSEGEPEVDIDQMLREIESR